MNHITRALLSVPLMVFSLPVWADLFTQVTPIYEPGVPIAQDMFGSTGVAISDNGLTFLTAAPNVVLPPGFGDGTGSGYPFQYVNRTWTTLGGYVSGPSELNGYGTGLSLSADGNTGFLGFGPTNPMDVLVLANVSAIQIGVGLDGLFYDPSGDLFSGFGSTGALSGDGHTVIIGAPDATLSAVSSVGQAVIYTYNGSTWDPTTISDPDDTIGDSFSSAVAMSADGTAGLIGSYSVGGKAYLYNLVAGVWTQTQEFDDVAICQGCMALSADGQTAIIATDSGVTVYAASDSPAWSGTPISITNGSGQLAMSADGKTFLIGTFGNTAYLYTLSGGIWGLAPVYNTFSGGMTSDYDGFGYTGVALSSDKETVAISAGFATISGVTQAGAVYIYQSPADLSLAMTATPALVALNQQVALNVTVTNNDTQVRAYNVVFTDTLPAGLTYVGSTAAGGNCSASGATVTCTLASLAPGAITVWQPAITVQVSTAGTYSDSAGVTSNQPDPDTTNNSASVSISMLPPTVSNGSVTTNQNTPVNGILAGTNPCNCGTPAFSVVASPSHGSVTITDAATGAFTYTPAAGYSGSDNFTFHLANGLNTSGTATESITVNALPPTVSDGSVTTDQDTSVNGTLSGANPCSCGTPAFSVVASPSHGSVTITDAATGAFTYTPAMGYSGGDSFTFQLTNGVNTSATATESVTVNSGGGGGGGGGGVDFFALGLLGALLAMIQRRRTRR